MKRAARNILTLIVFGLTLASLVSQTSAKGLFEHLNSQASPFQIGNVWQRSGQAAIASRVAGLPNQFETFQLDKPALRSILETAPSESVVALRDSQTLLSLPMPDGSFAAFRIQDAPVMMPDGAARFPDIKSYRIIGVEDGTITGRFDLTPQGFHAIILTGGEVINILPADNGNPELYASYRNDQIDGESMKAACGVVDEQLDGQRPLEETGQLSPSVALGPTLRTYRIAIAATWEYTNKLGDNTVAGTVASINTWLMGANAFYEREMSIRLLLVNNTNIIFSTDRGFNATNQPYTNETDDLLTQNSIVLRDQVGVDNYNLGHVLGDGSRQHGGVAFIRSVCENRTLQNAGPIKGSGFSRVIAPAGNGTSLGIFVHELAHQFGAPHTHNAGPCSGYTADNGYEPGGGNTIMAYKGNCGVNAYGPPFGSDYFHSRSIAQMSDFVINGTGATCAVLSNTGNTAPVVTAPAGFNIPKQTPFMLTATANDPDPGDNNNLTYSWEQYQAGGNQFPNPAFSDAGDPVTTTRPILRPFAPTTNPSRMFPSLQYILNNANVPPDVVTVTLPNSFPPTLTRRSGESLPQVARTLPFRVIVRDNAGGSNDATTTLTVDGNSGPFRITSPNTAVTLAGGSNQTVTWDVANTNNAPVSVANVRITLSTDGGQTFPTVLAASVPNNGTANVTIPTGIASTTARIKIEAVGNIFFDISDTNFTITLGGTCPLINDFTPKLASAGTVVTITGVNFTGVSAVRFNNNVTATFTVVSDTQITATVPAGAVGGAITMSKPGCGDAQTDSITICSGTATTIAADNGTFNFQGGGFTAFDTPRTTYAVNRLTPASYPATLSAVSIRFPAVGDLPAGTVVNVLAGVNPSGNNNVSNVPLQATPITLPTDRTAFAAFPVAPVTITSGDFVVGYSFVTPPRLRYFGVALDPGPSQNRSHISTDGQFFTQSTAAGNYMIRAVTFGACSSTSACAYTITPGNQNIAGTGGNGTITIAASSANCPWTAFRSIRWITLTSATTGSGNGTLNFSVAANDTTIARTGTITVAGRTFTVTQDAGTAQACNYVLNPAAANIAGTATAGNTFNVAVAAGCAWTATTTDNWLTITGGATGTGNGPVTYSAAANPSADARTGRITVAGQAFTVTQAGTAPVCNYTLDPVNLDLPAAAATARTFAVNVAAGCAWTAATNDNWITITGGQGTGNGTVTFNVAANASTTDARVGTITVGGQAFRVNQAAAVANCNYAINPTSFLAAATASDGNTFAIATAAGCQWTAVANAAWITIATGANGIGDGTVTYSLQANPSTTNARIGTITAAGQTFTVRQPAANQPCLPVNGGLLNWYRGEGNLFDAISANDGTATGNVAFVADGRIGQGMRFDGASSVALQRQVADNLSLEFWLRTQSTGGASETDWTQGAGLVANADFGVSLGNGKVLFGVGNTTIASANTVNDNQWHHVVAARNRTSGAMRLYIDGNPAPANATGGTQALNGTAQLVLGRRGAAGAFYTGDLDEVKIFENDLADDQSLAAFNGCNQMERATINNRTVPEGDPNVNGEFTNMNFTVTLSSVVSQDVIIHYATSDLTAQEGVDYIASYGTLVIPAGQTTGTIIVQVVNDNSDEPDRQFEVELFDPINTELADDEGIGTILDDDSPCEFTLSPGSASLGSSTSSSNSFAVAGSQGCGWTASTGTSWLTVTNGTTGNGNGTVSYAAAANTGTARSGSIIVAGQLFRVDQAGTTAVTAKPTFDFDGDRKSDIGVFRPSNGLWFVQPSSGGGDRITNFGLASDKLTPADFDGDGKTDIAVYRPSTGTWYVLSSSNGTVTVVNFGLAADIPAPGDYDGDGRADIANFRPSDGTWYIIRSTAGLQLMQFGTNGDIPCPGDYDGDGKNDLVVWRPSNGVWFERRSTGSDFAVQFGVSTDKVANADYDGDGKMDVAVYRPSNSAWYSINSSNGAYPVTIFGLSTDITVPADYDGDGRADIAIYRPSTGQWWLNRTTSGLTVIPYGLSTDKPIENAFGN